VGLFHPIKPLRSANLKNGEARDSSSANGHQTRGHRGYIVAVRPFAGVAFVTRGKILFFFAYLPGVFSCL
jgi:hypothetical protein